MKIVITGHTRGIGFKTYTLLIKQGYEVFGLSRSNGYDISDTRNIIHTIKTYDADVFINNAFAPINQTTLLKEIYKIWKERDKLIINICSAAALIPREYPDYNMPYASDKREQKHFCESVNFNYSKTEFQNIKCRLTNLNFDYVKTEFNSKYDKRKFPNLLPEDIASIIKYIIDGYDKNICFREISLHSTNRPELI